MRQFFGELIYILKFTFMKIVVSTEKRKQIKEHFACDDATISHALNFKGDSQTLRRIRSYAMNRMGGAVI